MRQKTPHQAIGSPRNLLRWGLLALCLLGAFSALAGPPAESVRFEHPFDRTDAKRHKLGGILSIVQDDFGFIWLGAENGLARYDGRNLRLYQADPQNSRSLPGNLIWRLIVDKDGVFWQAGEGGLSRYNPETDDFTTVSQIGGVNLLSAATTALAIAQDNTLYVGAGGALHIIAPDRDSMEIVRLDPPGFDQADVDQVRSIAIDAQGKVWLGTAGQGLAIFDPATQHLDYLLHHPNDPEFPVFDHVRSIAHDSQGHVWLGTYRRGIGRLEPGTSEYIHFSHDPEDPTSLGSDIVLHVMEDSQGIIWVALDQGGLARFDDTSQSFVHHRHSPNNPHSLISNQLRAVYEDKNQDIWVGAFPSGVSFYNRSAQRFRLYIHIPDDPNSLSDSAILQILEARDGTIWIGTENGLNALDPDTGSLRRYLSDPSNPQALQARPVLALAEDPVDGQLWLGTWAGGLHRFDPDTDQFQHYPADDHQAGAMKSDFIWSIIVDSNDVVWIGTEDQGLQRYQRDTDSFDQFRHRPDQSDSISGNFVPTIAEGKDGSIWVGTFSGLNRLNPETEQFSQVTLWQTTDLVAIRKLFKDSRGKLWIGTERHGVGLYDPDEGSFTNLSIADGLPSPNVSSIVEDHHGNIWVTTTNGLIRIDRQTLRVSRLQHEEGVAGINFNRDASLRDRRGNLYFGSTEGMTVFHPDHLDIGATDFPLYVTNFRLFNQEVPIGTPASPLRTSTFTADEIVLRHRDVMFSFELAALNYRQSTSIRYSYMLDGFDRHWNDITQGSVATYTNIAPGRYRFRTRASTDGENWVSGQSLDLIILPPPWRTWWAYTLYSLIAILALYLAHKYVTLSVRAEVYRSRSITDPLTGLYNRAGMAQIAKGIFANPETKKGMCLMILDIDHFKDINDQLGHDAGDRILCTLAKVMRACLRNSDHIGRWGGEEFVLLCPTDNRENSRLLAEKLRKSVEQQIHDAQLPRQVTASIGVTCLLPEDNFESALKRADKALYAAKASGRNRVEMH